MLKSYAQSNASYISVQHNKNPRNAQSQKNLSTRFTSNAT